MLNNIDVILDQLTPCLIHRRTGEIYDTEVSPLFQCELDENGRPKGWGIDKWGELSFDWRKCVQDPANKIFKLTIKEYDLIQGLVCFELKEGYVELHLVENAPWNIGEEREFDGVGGHLFAIASKYSFEQGSDGFVAFTAKSDLIEHYISSLDAKFLNARSYRLMLDNVASQRLVDIYFKK